MLDLTLVALLGALQASVSIQVVEMVAERSEIVASILELLENP
jgi:hypothetical protein